MRNLNLFDDWTLDAAHIEYRGRMIGKGYHPLGNRITGHAQGDQVSLRGHLCSHRVKYSVFHRPQSGIWVWLNTHDALYQPSLLGGFANGAANQAHTNNG
jgi:hypothetical protein